MNSKGIVSRHTARAATIAPIAIPNANAKGSKIKLPKNPQHRVSLQQKTPNGRQMPKTIGTTGKITGANKISINSLKIVKQILLDPN